MLSFFSPRFLIPLFGPNKLPSVSFYFQNHIFSRVHATISRFVGLSVDRSIRRSLITRSTRLVAIGLVYFSIIVTSLYCVRYEIIANVEAAVKWKPYLSLPYNHHVRFLAAITCCFSRVHYQHYNKNAFYFATSSMSYLGENVLAGKFDYQRASILDLEFQPPS